MFIKKFFLTLYHIFRLNCRIKIHRVFFTIFLKKIEHYLIKSNFTLLMYYINRKFLMFKNVQSGEISTYLKQHDNFDFIVKKIF